MLRKLEFRRGGIIEIENNSEVYKLRLRYNKNEFVLDYEISLHYIYTKQKTTLHTLIQFASIE